MSIEKINIANLKSLGPYSHATYLNGFYFFSGQVGFNFKTNKLVSNDVVKQMQQIFKNIDLLLEECKLNIENIVKSTIFVDDINNFAIINEMYKDYMNGHFPARSFMQVARLPLDAKVEIELILGKEKNAENQ
jgi:2-iminobutanoate/2-iminopropanoate deaminase